MTTTTRSELSPPLFGVSTILKAAVVLLIILGLLGSSHAAVGYGLFMVATLLLGMGFVLLAIFAFTRWFNNGPLRRAYIGAFWMGAWIYVLALAAMTGYYIHEALAARIEWKFMIFGPAVMAAIITLDIGIWRVIVKRNQPTVRRFGDLWRRESLDPQSLKRTFFDEVLLHKTLLSVSPFRWIRHQLIFWGFGAMFLVEVAAVMFREVLPAFGISSPWHQADHPIRLAFDFAYDFTGLMILVGCILALLFRIRAQGTEQQKYTDTPTAVFLLIVVVTGFLTEGARMALLSEATGTSASFVGLAFAAVSPASSAWYDTMWVVHAILVCAFIAYIPLKRMIHSCAVPIGRLVNSQVGLLAAKKARAIGGLFRGQKTSP